MARLFALGLATLCAAGLAAAPAHAAPSPADAKVRVHVDTDFFGFTHFIPDADLPSINAVGFGIGRPSFVDSGGPAFFSRPMLTIGVGAVLLRQHLVVGARAGVVYDGSFVDDADQSAVGGRFVPYANFMFNPKGRVRGYIGGHGGFGGTAVTYENMLASSSTVLRDHVIFPVAGAQGGVHVFIVDRVSIDPGASFDYLAPYGRTVQIDPEPSADPAEFDELGDAINFALTVGLSAWF